MHSISGSTLSFYDFRYFVDLHAIVSVEPVQARDKVMMGMLASIGIEPGKPFAPSADMKKILTRARPLRGRIGRLDELRRHVARRAEGRVVEGGQILLHGPARRLGITLLVPVLAGDRPVLVDVRSDRAGIDCEAFAADQARDTLK